MNNSKIYLFISSLTPKEKKKIKKLIEAEYFKLNEIEAEILKSIIEQPNLLDNKTKLYTQFSADNSYNDQKCRLYLSKAFKSLEHFAAINQIEQKDNEAIKNLFLSRYYRKKELNKLYLSLSSTNYAPMNEEHPVKLDIQLEHAFEEYQFNSLQKRNQELNIQNLLDLADKNFYAQKLRFSCYALSHGAIYSKEYNFGNIDFILNAIESQSLVTDPRVGVYYHCYKMIKNPEVEAFYLDYKKILFEQQRIFNIEEKRSLYFFALNHCIKKLNSGDKNFGVEGLDIYQNAIANSTLLINGYLSRFTYRNVAMMAIRINDFELADTLTVDYETLLRREDRESAFHFNKALINYYKKELNLALENIMLADFKDHLINLAAKSLQAKIYFELEEEKLLDSHLDSLEVYLIRKKVLGYHRKNYKNFIKYTKKLIRTNPYNKDALIKLKKRIVEEEVLTERKWLLDRIKL